MKAKILEISPESAHYENRNDIIGCVGELTKCNRIDENWDFVILEHCHYENNNGYGTEGDTTAVYGAKIELVGD